MADYEVIGSNPPKEDYEVIGSNPSSVQKQSYGQSIMSKTREIIPTMLGQLKKIEPTDIISGVAPYKIAQDVYSGIKDVAIPQRKTSPFFRTVTDIALAPETYLGGRPIVGKGIIKTGKILRSGVGVSSDSARW